VVLSKIVLILTQDRCIVCVEHTIGLEIIVDASNITLRRQCYFRCKVGAQFVRNVPTAQKSFWTHPMVLPGDEAQVKAHFVPFADSANLHAR
jgi:hypothetical protein